jgi:hypothetical protein
MISSPSCTTCTEEGQPETRTNSNLRHRMKWAPSTVVTVSRAHTLYPTLSHTYIHTHTHMHTHTVTAGVCAVNGCNDIF